MSKDNIAAVKTASQGAAERAVPADPTPELQRMTAHRAAYFMERFLKEEKLLGPNEQAALHFVIAMLEAQPALGVESNTAGAAPDERTVFETWARVRSDWRPNLTRKGEGYVGAFADEAWRAWQARASHGQAPAGAAIDLKVAAQAIAVEVAKNCGSVPQLTFPHIYLGLKDLLSPTAQAAPAAGVVAVSPEQQVHGPYTCAFMGAGVWAGITEELPPSLIGKKVYVTTIPPTPAAQADGGAEERDDLVSLIAECRNVFPIPEEGHPLEVHWRAAMADPMHVPGYLQEIAKSRAQADSGVVEDAARQFPALTPELESILGTMCFQCIAIAQALRAAGHLINTKAEAEQAAVLHWMLGHYFRHGDEGWRKAASDDMGRMRDEFAARATGAKP